METIKYKVLKEFGELKEGEVFARDSFDETDERMEEMVAEGILELVAENDKFVVTQDHLDSNPFFASLGIPVGTELEYDPTVVISREDAIAQGIDVETIEKETLAAKEKEEESNDNVGVAPSGPEKTLDGKKVISETNRIVNEKTYHVIRLEDGSTQDLTDEEYEAKVKVVETNE